ncbi:MAG: hypothetical protein HQL37_12330 [Alphaproteobacteria bacterium]|nr:hypothetical protein [Alphaproteobacteria bacterium]
MIGKCTTFALAAASFLVGMMAAAYCGDGIDWFRLAERRFAVPHRYMVPGFDLPAWVKELPHTDEEDRDMLVTVPAAELAAAIPGYRPWEGRYSADSFIRLEVVPQARLKLDASRRFKETWAMTGTFIERRVEPDPLPGLFRVYGQYDYPRHWHVLRVSPETAPMPEEVFPTWVATCSDVKTPVTPEGHLSTCDSMLQIDNVRVHFHFTYNNLVYIGEIKEVLETLVTGWMVDGVRGPILK